MKTRVMALGLVWLGVAALSAAPVLLDRTVARVGEQVVLLSDLRVARALGLVEAGPGDGVVARAVMDRVLMLLEVSRYQPAEPSPADVVREVDALKAKAGTGVQLAALMAETGLTETRLTALARENLRLRSYLQQRFSGAPTPQAVSAWVKDLRPRTESECRLPGC